MEGMLGSADVAVVTGESVSMVSEGCASGRPVIVVTPPLRPSRRAARTKHERFLHDLAEQGYARMAQVTEVGTTIHRALRHQQPSSIRLDNLAAVCGALTRLL